jgi:hypothetical protein
MDLVKNSFSNYVCQVIVEKCKPDIKNILLNKLRGHYFELSQHKFASNVIEKCVVFTFDNQIFINYQTFKFFFFLKEMKL